jgi:hypothetical protein
MLNLLIHYYKIIHLVHFKTMKRYIICYKDNSLYERRSKIQPIGCATSPKKSVSYYPFSMVTIHPVCSISRAFHHLCDVAYPPLSSVPEKVTRQQ